MTNRTRKDAPRTQCTICSHLSNQESAYQKYGSEQNNTYLPDAASHLNVVRDFYPNNSRKLQLRQCPGCGVYYLYSSDYEYLAIGSEDEEQLTRITEEQAADYLNRPVP